MYMPLSAQIFPWVWSWLWGHTDYAVSGWLDGWYSNFLLAHRPSPTCHPDNSLPLPWSAFHILLMLQNWPMLWPTSPHCRLNMYPNHRVHRPSCYAWAYSIPARRALGDAGKHLEYQPSNYPTIALSECNSHHQTWDRANKLNELQPGFTHSGYWLKMRCSRRKWI